MRRIGLCLLLHFVLAFFPRWISAEGGKVSLASLDWPPYISRSAGKSGSPGSGYVADVAREAFQASGYTVNITFMDWKDALERTKMGSFDALLPEYFSREREEAFACSDAFPGGTLSFMKRSSDGISFRTLKDLGGYSIGVVAGYVNTREFDDAAYLMKDRAANDELNIRKLMAGRVDLILIDRNVGTYLIDTNMPEFKGKADFLEPEPDEKSLNGGSR